MCGLPAAPLRSAADAADKADRLAIRCFRGGTLLLHLTLAWPSGFHPPGHQGKPGTCRSGTREIVVEITPGTTGSSVAALLTARYGPASLAIHGTALADLTPGRRPFVNGAVITCSPPGSPPPRGETRKPAPASLLFAVCGGPDIGNIIPLQRGTYSIGRLSPSGSGPRIGIADPALSRSHALLVVGKDSVQLRDLGSANGTWVDGRRVRSAVVDTGSALRFGYSTCRLAVPADVAAPGPGVPDPFTPLTVQLQEQGSKAGFLLVGGLLPLVMGVVLALVTGMWMFLAFSALSAVTAVLGAAGARRRRREQAQTVSCAATEDARRRRQAAPDAGSMALAAVLGIAPAKPSLEASAPGRPSTECPVRIGTAAQAANLLPVPARPHFVPPVTPDLPVILRLGHDRDICLRGVDGDALFRTILLQAASSPAAGTRLHVVCAGTPARLDPEARFLPGVTLAPLPEAAPAAVASAAAGIAAMHEEVGPGDAAVLVLCVQGGWAHYGRDLIAALPAELRESTSLIRLGGPPAGLTVSASSARGTVTGGADPLEFVPDLVQGAAFGRISRALGTARAPDELARTAQPVPGRLPRSAAFTGLHQLDPEVLLQKWTSGGAGARAVVGVSAAGPVVLDLVRDGPHFLVAGTTGSGKSEFLRSFVTSLAANQPPSAVAVLLIDFKGGAGLGPLVRLPHAVGLLTDLSAGDVSRALASLRAEVRRREALLAEAGADNLDGYNSRRASADTLPRLVVVIDEFRMLADEVPAALPELLRIAAVGRSLGLHLVLATQRPQGAVTADIRANIATSIALRVSSAAESRDVLNSDCAAGIAPDLPGRAFLSKGGGPPLAFQSVSTAVGQPGSGTLLMELDEYFRSRQAAPQTAPLFEADCLDRICSGIRLAATRGCYPEPFHPIAPPLPRTLVPGSLPGHAESAAGSVVLGLLDDPSKQQQRLLSWHPAVDAHLAVLGSPRSGAADCLQLATAGLLAAGPGRHLYVLDADGSLARLADAEQTGAYVGPQEVKRAARVLTYLAAEVVQKSGRADPGTRGPAGAAAGPGIILAISGWARWCTGFRSGRGLTGEEDLADIIRDGERAGVCVVITGDRELFNSRCFPLIPNRVFFPADATAETLLLWPRLPPMDPVRGRALAQGRIATGDGLVAQIYTADPDRCPARQAGAGVFPSLPPGCPPPHRIAPLPALVRSEQLSPASDADYLPVGVGGDELETVMARIPRGSVFLVAGPRGSGRTSFLRQLERAANDSLHCRWATGGEDLAGGPPAGAGAGSPPDGNLLVLVDDADLLPPSVHGQLAALHARGARLVLAAVSGPQLTARVPLALQVRSNPLGALLRPLSPADGDIFGIRVDPGVRRPPGRCFLVDGAEAVEAQTAWSGG